MGVWRFSYFELLPVVIDAYAPLIASKELRYNAMALGARIVDNGIECLRAENDSHWTKSSRVHMMGLVQLKILEESPYGSCRHHRFIIKRMRPRLDVW